MILYLLVSYYCYKKERSVIWDDLVDFVWFMRDAHLAHPFEGFSFEIRIFLLTHGDCPYLIYLHRHKKKLGHNSIFIPPSSLLSAI